MRSLFRVVVLDLPRPGGAGAFCANRVRHANPRGGVLERFGQVSINDNGDLAFNSLIEGEVEGGVFLLTKEGLAAVALSGDQAPGGGVIIGSHKPVLNNSSQVLFTATVGEAEMRKALYLYSEGQLNLIAHEGQQVESRSRLTGIFDHDLNNKGEIVFMSATYTEGAGNTSAVFRCVDGGIVHIAAGGDRDADGETIVKPERVSINDAGEVAFADNMRTTPGGLSTGARIFQSAPGGIPHSVFGIDQPLGSIGRAQFSPFRGIRASNLNLTGKIAILTGFEGSPGSGRSILIWSPLGQEAAKIAQEGIRLGNARIIGFLDPMIHDNDLVAFLALVDENSAGERQALGVSRRGAPQILYRQGDEVPGLPGVTFRRFRHVDVNNADEIAFTAELDGSGPREGVFVLK